MTKSAITFAETGFERKGEQAGAIIWLTPDGDMPGLFHYALRPDIKAELHDVEDLRRFYRESAREAGLGVIWSRPSRSRTMLK